MFLVGRVVVPLTGRMTILGLVGAVLPFVFLYVDALLLRLLRETPAEG